MKKRSLLVWTIAALAISLIGIAMALTPPPPPPPPVNQTIGLYDTGVDNLVTNATDQSLCRYCHITSGTVVPNGSYSNTTLGGVPTRHHSLLPRGIINPYTNAPFGCQDCHPSLGIGNGILLDRSCVDCHNGTAFTASGAKVGNMSRPHHVNTSYASSNIGNPAAARNCSLCHGSFVANYNDGHYKPTYATDFMITPFAGFKATSSVLNDPTIGGNKTWGGCASCHEANSSATPMEIDSNHDTHHKEILGFGRFGGKTPYQNASTPFVPYPAGTTRQCYWCHVINGTSGSYIIFDITNPFTGEHLHQMEVRNSTIEATSAIEPGTTNITFNGTGCEKCHSVQSLHNIQVNYSQNGPQGLGHINNNTDCYGCHNSWLPATDFVPGALIPYVDSVSPSVIATGTATTLTITGSNFVNDAYTSVVTVDGVTYTPTSITNTQIVVNIPALNAGTHKLQLVKGGDTLSKLSTLIVVPAPTITSVKLGTGKDKGSLTITGKGFGAKPQNAQYYVSVRDAAGNQIISTSVTAWSDTQIKAKNSAAKSGLIVTVITADSGETKATIK